MKKNLLLFVLFLSAVLVKAQETWFFEDFNSGRIPEGFKLYDLDGLTPNSQVAAYGFKAGVPWVVLGLTSTNLVAVSTSFYSPAGTSDDWLVTSGIEVKSKGGYLAWKAYGIDPDFPDGYKVLISTKGQKVEDFTDEPIFSIDGEKGDDFVSRTFSLDDYVGSTIYVAFVNNSYDKYLLMLDDIFVGIPASHEFENATQKYYTEAGEKQIKGKITAGLVDKITGFTAQLEYNGKTVEQTFSDLNIAPTKSYTFTFNEKVPVEAGKATDYKITIKAFGNQGDLTAENQVVCLGEKYERNVVMEEATGTWCGFCPRGAVGLEAMSEKYPEFIGIAVHDGDPMMVEEYDERISSYISGYPSAVINRKYEVDPYYGTGDTAMGIENFYKEVKKEIPAGVISMVADYTSESQDEISVVIKAKFAYSTNKMNMNFGVVLAEDKVQGKNSNYNQANYYADGEMGEMGGYENLPEKVSYSKMVYGHVARGIYSGFDGIPNSVPASITQGEEITYTYTFPLPNNVTQTGIENKIFNKENVEVIGMLIDAETGEIWNAARVKASEFPSDIKTVGTDGLTVKSVVTDGQLNIDIKNVNQKVSVEIYGTDGCKVAEREVDSDQVITIPTNGMKGVHFVRTSDGKHITVNKVIF